jgi:hypothetical protein
MHDVAVPDGGEGHERTGGLNILRVYVGTGIVHRGIRGGDKHVLIKDRPNREIANALLRKYGNIPILPHNAKAKLNWIMRNEIMRKAGRTIGRFCRSMLNRTQ